MGICNARSRHKEPAASGHGKDCGRNTNRAAAESLGYAMPIDQQKSGWFLEQQL